MNIVLPCKQHLGFDDRWFMRIGIPLLSLAMPFILNFAYKDGASFWLSQFPESLIYVSVFWMFYRSLCIILHIKLPEFSQTHKRITLEIIIFLLSAPILKSVLNGLTEWILELCQIVDFEKPGHVQTLVAIYLPSGLILALYEAMYFFSKYKESLVEREKLEKIHIQTQLDNLRNQINPHFLFNSLNTLMNLIPTNQEAAMSYLSKLSKFYRYSVGVKEEMKIPLAKELECASLYAHLLKERFREGIQVTIESDSENSEYFVLPMSLQLLVENAVKHNIVSKSKPLHIDISISKEQKYVVVKNNLQKKIEAVASTGMGLKNIKERYTYFTDREMLCEQNENEFIVSLPLLKS